MNTRYALPCAGLLALAGLHCASTSKQASENPTTAQVASSQQASEQEMKRAADKQQQASDQAKKSAEAQGQIRRDEQKLQQDQEIAKQEQTKAQQSQLEANQQGQQARQQVQQNQQTAATELSQQTQDVAKGQDVAAGIVTEVRPDEVAVRSATGKAMKFRVDDRTKVQIEGRTSSAEELREGQQARVAYEPSGAGPRAVSIRVAAAGSSGTTGSDNTSPPSSSPAPSDPSQTPAPGAPGSR